MHCRHQVVIAAACSRRSACGADLHDDLVELVLQRVYLELLDRGRNGDVDVVVGILDLDPLEFLVCPRGVGEDTDNVQPLIDSP